MSAISSYLENVLLAEVLRNTSYTPPVQVFLALYTTNPTAADSGTEVTGGSYTRPVISFGAPSGGVISNSADVTITGMPATTVSYMGVRDAASGGHLLIYGPLTLPKVTNAGDSFVVRAGDLSITIS